MKIDIGEYHLKNSHPLSGFPSLVLRLPIAILISYSFSHIYANIYKFIHTPKAYMCTRTHTHTPWIICCILSYYLLCSLRNISWSFFLVKYIYSSFCIMNSYYHNSFRQMPLGIRHDILVWESPRKYNIWYSSPWDIFSNELVTD